MKTKKILSGFLAAVMVLSLAGCTNNGGTGDTTTADTTTTADGGVTAADTTSGDVVIPEGLTLKVLTHRTDLKENGYLDEMTQAFEDKFNCTVVYEGHTKYAGDVSTMMSTTEYGDVLMIPDTIKLTDLKDFIEPLGTYDELSADYLWADKKMFDGTVYGLAHIGTVAGGICYNKRIWAEAGVTTLPTTPEEFIEDLKLIRDNTDAIPYYTNFNSNWTIAQWPGLVMSISGDPDYENNALINGDNLFAEGSPYYKTYKLMFDVYSDRSLIEEDPMGCDWEASKPAINDGTIATMTMGSWAVSQFQAAGDHPEDIGYMPAPFTTDGKQYAETSADYCLGINKNISDDLKALAKEYIFWFINDSGFSIHEGGISARRGSAMPDYLEAFENCEFFIKTAAPEGLVGTFDEIDKASDVGTWLDDSTNFKILIAQAALSGEGMSKFEEILATANDKYQAARSANETLAAYLAAQ